MLRITQPLLQFVSIVAFPPIPLAPLLWGSQSFFATGAIDRREGVMDGNYWSLRVLMDETERHGNHINATEFHTNAVRNKNQIYSQRREGRHNMFPLYSLLKRYICPRIEDFIWISEIYSLYKSWYAKKIIVPEGTKVWFVPLVPSLPLKAKPPCSDLHSYSSIRRILESIRDCFRQPGIFLWSQPIYSHFTFSGFS